MKLLFYILVTLFPSVLLCQSASISGIINSYAIVTGISCQSINVNATTGFTSGDRVILIQMKGAIMDSSNTTSFGQILNYNGAGNYEIASIASVSGNVINFTDSILRQYFIGGSVQLVKVPVYNNVTVTGPLTCMAWNGSTGGILAFEATGIVNLNADVDVSGKGFRGGVLYNGSLVNCLGDTGSYSLSSAAASSARKGEGIVNDNLARANGKGPNVNGGGSGEDCNGGGAGGGNLGMGGHGGDSKCNVSCPPYFYQNSGGYPGKNLTYSNNVAKIFSGGGGGAGHENNSGGTSGTNGGGIIIIKADSIAGNNHFVKSNGLDNNSIANIDGQGGGGAGGTILFCSRAYSSLNVCAQGGKGGEDNFTGSDCHGKGGGGGGGVMWTSASVSNITSYLGGGASGIFTSSGSLCYGGSNGALAGQPGGTRIDLHIPESTSPCTINAINSLKSIQYSIKFYPNPFSGSVTLRSDISLTKAALSIFDLLGNEVKRMYVSGQEIKIDTFGFIEGLYFFKLTLGDEVITGKLIAE